MNCLNCNNDTENPKFCSRSCSATYNNKKSPKRKASGTCLLCGISCTRDRTYCRSCWIIESQKRSASKWDNETLKSMKGYGNANYNGRYPYIRSLSREKYLKSNKDKFCFVCGYDYHFDVCHIKDLKNFDENTKISVVNSLDNLVALCKNHHWEFDSGLISL